MIDPAARLTEALDRAEQQARSAMHLGDGKWRVEHGYGKSCPDGCGCRRIEGVEITIYDEGGHDEHQAAHIAAWDPARILALITRDRALLADHAAAEAAFADPTTALAPTIQVARNNRRITLRDEVERAAAFWIPEETP